MAFLWFVVAVIFFALWLNKKSDTSKDTYAQGYWDGYRALAKKVRHEIDQKSVNFSALRQLIQQSGLGDDDSQTESSADQESQPNDAANLTASESAQEGLVQSQPKDDSAKNLNILLFAASLLLVAAGAAFVATAMPDIVKLFGIWLLVAAFYASGMILHRSSTRLRPAAVAFLGTGLGIIPFAGVALYQLTGIDPALAWCLTSLAGLVAYFAAAIRLQSQVVAYLTVGFVISLASSFTETISLSIIWNFVVIIGISLLASVISFVKPNLLPKIFSEPIERTGQLVTPLALLASMLLADKMTVLAYEVVFGFATIHYIVAWLQTRQQTFESLARILAHITALIIGWDIAAGDQILFGTIVLGLAILQQLYSLIAKSRIQEKNRTSLETVWILAMQVVQFVTLLFWIGSPDVSMLSSLSLAAIGLSSVAAAFVFRNIFLAIPLVMVSIILPMVIIRGVFQPALDWSYYVTALLAGGLFVLALWHQATTHSKAIQRFLVASLIAYVVVATLVTSFLAAASSAIFLAVLVVICWSATYIMRGPLLSFIGNFLVFLTIVQTWRALEFDQGWLVLGTAWISAGIFYVAHWLMVRSGDNTRAVGLLMSTWLALCFGAVLKFFDTDYQLAAALTIVVLGLTVAGEGLRRKQAGFIEAAVYITTFGLQRAIGVTYEDLNPVFYAHWWAMTAAGVAWWRHLFTVRLKIAMGFVTVSTGLYALSDGGWYQLLFLVEHLGLLVAGALLSKRWAIWWGLVASVLAVLYFLKDFAFLALGFLGLVIIGIVVWRLMKAGQN